jgi:hypothetical protein
VVPLHHFLFADDTLIFCEANPDHLHNLRCLFLCFKAVLGLKISLSKSELVLVDAMEELEAWLVSLVVGCPLCL